MKVVERNFIGCATGRQWGVVLGLAWVLAGAGPAWALLFKPLHTANHALCCGMVSAEGFAVKASGAVPAPLVNAADKGAGAVAKVEAKPAEDPLANLPPIAEVNGALVLNFDRLAGYLVKQPTVYRATPETPIVVPEIPASLRAINGRQAVVSGFMLPLKLEGGRTTEFLLMRDQSLCCFGRVPMLNEWIYVRMPKGTETAKDVPVSFRGKLSVGEQLDDGYLIGIYLLEAEAFVSEKG